MRNHHQHFYSNLFPVNDNLLFSQNRPTQPGNNDIYNTEVKNVNNDSMIF